MSDDIVKRLRDEIDVDVNEPLDRLLEEAADEVERLSAVRAGSALLDRMQETRIFVLPGGERGVICGGRFDGWLCWLHPDGQFVTLEKLKAEAPRSLFNEPQEG